MNKDSQYCMKYFRTYTICLLMIALLLSRAVKQTHAQVIADITLGPSLGTISKNIWGVDFQSLGSPTTSIDFFTNYISQPSLTNLGAQMFRFPGGCAADSYDWVTGSIVTTAGSRLYLKIDDAIQIAGNNTGGELLFQVNINGSDLPNATQPNICGEVSQNKTSAGLLADIPLILGNAQYISAIQYFELGNAQWSSWNPNDYSAQAILYAKAIKAIKPTAKVGLVGYPSLAPTSAQKTAWDSMIQTTMNDATCGATNNLPCFDFVTDHQYPQAKAPAFNGQAAYYPITNLGTQLPQLIKAYPGKQYAFSEWNLSCGAYSTDPLVSMTNTVDHGIFTFNSFFVMARNKVSIANYHDLSVNSALNPAACGLFSGPNTLTATGQAFSLSSVAAGGELYDIPYVFPNNDGFIQLPPNNPTCTDADCLPQTSKNISVLSAFAAKQRNDLYIFLINRSDAAVANPTTINAKITIPTWPGYDKQVIMEQLVATSFGDGTFAPLPIQTILNQTTPQFQADLLATSITRIRIADHFVGAPAPTPTAAIFPTTNTTIIQKLVNLKQTETRKCTQDLLMFIIASAVYIMIIRFAIAINEDFKLNLHITCFVIGGIIGYYLCNLDIGFVLAVVLSLFLW